MSKKVTSKIAETPLMKQFNQIKAKHPDAILLFRVGDFYETFGEDAKKASHVLGIVLTKRKNGAAGAVELAGFPHHSLDTYLPKLVRAGFRVAICDQLEDPKKTKTIVKRGITELVTPGVAYNDNILDNRKNNFLCSLYFDKNEAGVSFLDISTGEFLTAQGSIEYINKLISSYQPSEILFQKSKRTKFYELIETDVHTYGIDDWVFSDDYCKEILQNHFGTITLKGFGIEDFKLSIISAGVALYYLEDTRHDKLKHINHISRIEQDHYMWLDKFTIRNLELFNSLSPNGTSLIDIIDSSNTSMGARLLKKWIAFPLKQASSINWRLEIVDYLFKNQETRNALIELLKKIGDVERLISKVSVGKVNPKELLFLKRSLKAINPIKDICEKTNNDHIKQLQDKLNPCKLIIDKLDKWIAEDPPILISKGGVIADQVNEELDEYRKLAYSGKDYLIQIQNRESKKTEIPSLKIGYNNVFGYYLEVTNRHKDRVPEDWIRKQTLVNAERYITPELKEYEVKILSAEEKIGEIELRLYQELISEVILYLEPIQVNANVIAQIDCLCSFADIATKYNYSKPTLDGSNSLSILQGRHPVIEQCLPIDQSYVPNDLFLDKEKQQIIMITGPNMSGKSAILRQTALIVLLAQIGCFVPAEQTEIGIVDKIFTRVGASDNLSQGESTFMVEMNETASILNNLSDRSLILLDEIGRGTSTYDGISIAWAIAEYLHNHSTSPKTLFATHYHELNDMAKSFDRIKNYNVTIKEFKNRVIFLRKLAAGGSEHSFGIHVAKMAGIPNKVVNKANKILAKLESSHMSDQNKESLNRQQQEDFQLSFFQLDDPTINQIKEELINLDINKLTPVEALLKLNEIKNILKG